MEKEKLKHKIKSIAYIDSIHELLFSGLGCILFNLILPFFPKNYWNYVYRTTFILILAISFFLTFLIFNQSNPKFQFFKINYKRNIILFSIFNCIIWSFLFYKTPFGFLGISADNYYRSAFITHMAYSGYPQDFAYKGLSAFYAPFYWYCLALIAMIFHINPYKMVKIGFLISYCVMPIILYEFWKKIYDQKTAFMIVVVSFLIVGDIYSTDNMIGNLLIIPYILYYFENISQKKFKIRNYVIGGFIGSIIFCTYFLYFLIIPIFYIITLIQNKKKLIDNLKHIIRLSFFLILFAGWFWLPLLKDIITIGFESHQNRYYDPSILVFPAMLFFEISTFGIVYVIGILYIISKYSISNDLKILGNLLLSVHIVFLIGFIGIMNNFPIMHIRFLYVSLYILIISSSLFYIKLFNYIIKNNNFSRLKLKINLKQIEIYLLFLFLFIQSTNYIISISNSEYYEGTIEEDVPVEMIKVFEKLDYEEKVFLTDEYRIAAYLPIYLFLLPNPYYSHPSALYNERVKFLIDLSESDTPHSFHKKIIENRFGPIDYFFLDLEKNSTVLVFTVAIERFPEGRDYYDIEFRRELFIDEDLFEEIIIKGHIIYRTIY